ncbi:MAG: site-specific DNA-methyltransferase [Ignavibacteria bacterium]|nr:site-specific DNA-methyltransferase [Ignavibacteria bacterium]
MIEEMKNQILCGDALEILPIIPNNSIDLVLTDPPYFLDKLDDKWDPEKVATITDYCNVVRSLPPGMKFDKEQGKRFYEWFYKVSMEVFRVLKPGGFFFSFSSPRLYHRLVSAADDAGFLIRDCFIWLYTQNQPKAMSLNHFIDRMNLDGKSKEKIKSLLMGWKTPQVKSCFEPIMMAQKPCEGTFLENMLKYKVGLVNTNIKIGEDMFPSNVVTSENITQEIDKYFLVPKPSLKEKGKYNKHKTVKPISICEYIILLTTYDENALVLDPFIGSGTTALAAKNTKRSFIGIEINPEYVEIAKKRLRELVTSTRDTSNEKMLALFQEK